jgi:predicted metal-binding membrane protein
VRDSADRRWSAAAALAFVASAAVTVAWCASMSAMAGMSMPGGWTMSMAWMRMPGQGWTGAAAGFLGMWMVMMIAMMLPAFMPMLSRYRRAMSPAADAGTLTLRVAGGYFGVWTAAGVLVYPAGVFLAEVAMRAPSVARAVPFVAGVVTLLAGALQCGSWKARQLAACRDTIDCCRPPAANGAAAWRHGIDLGLRCLRCCAPLTALLLVLGVMDLRAMAAVTGAITLERVSKRGSTFARMIGAAMIVAGLLGTVRSLG